MKFRKKPVVIDAVQWDGENIKQVMDFMAWRNAEHDERHGLSIRTLEGTHHAAIGDYIIKGVQGEFYPCKPDVFALTYEPVGQPLCGLKIEIDTSEVDAALEKVEALGKAYRGPQLLSGTVSVEAVQGFTAGYAIDPLESAIELIVRMMDERMASDRSPSLNVGVMLMGHLEELLAEQLRRVTDPDKDATLVSHLNEMTRKLQSLIDVKASTAP